MTARLRSPLDQNPGRRRSVLPTLRDFQASGNSLTIRSISCSSMESRRLAGDTPPRLGP